MQQYKGHKFLSTIPQRVPPPLPVVRLPDPPAPLPDPLVLLLLPLPLLHVVRPEASPRVGVDGVAEPAFFPARLVYPGTLQLELTIVSVEIRSGFFRELNKMEF